jgi:trimeric autotransporter adhesin
VDTAGLATGTYGASVQVTGAGMANSPLSFPVVAMVNGGGDGKAAALTLGSPSLTFTSGRNGAAQQGTLSVTSGSATTSFSAVARTGTWLTLVGNSFTTPAVISMTVDPAGLGFGTYTDYIDLNGRAQSVPVTLVVTDAITGGNVTVTPTSLNFTYPLGGTAPAAQQLTVSSAITGAASISYSVSFSTTSGGAWLSATPQSGATQGTVTVSVNPVGLQTGSQIGMVRIRPTGGNPVDIPVTLTVTSPAISVDATELIFTYQAGASTNPAPKTVQVNGGPSASFTAQASSTGNWLSVSPASGTANGATLTVSVNPSGLEPGTPYHGTVVVSGAGGTGGSATIDVTLRVQAPAPTIGQVVNAANYYAGSVSPGEIVTLFGTNLGPTTPVGLALDANGNVATTVGGVKVFFSGFEAPIAFASAGQLNVVVPYEVKNYASVNVYTRFLDQGSNSIAIPVTATAPGIFTMDASGSGLGAILNADYTANGPDRPTGKDTSVMVYITGEGETSPNGVTGKVTVMRSSQPYTPAPLGNIAVLVDGQPAAVEFAGEAPGFVSGLLQLNVHIPANTRSGNVPIVVTIGSRSTQNGVTVSVR